MEPFVTEAGATHLSLASQWHVLSVQPTNGMVHVSVLSEVLTDLLPVIGAGGTQERPLHLSVA